ncbi:MAG: phosphocholine cytidylyltransferase family protein [Deltaproteobacteria bacterium]|nr:phosphocholine cytidylyltransferase family protein [Deltaproteobacteria bacterium]
MDTRLAVILAAGTASRLGRLARETPKCLLPVAGKSFLGRALESFAENGIRRFCIVTGYLAPQVKAFVTREYPDFDARFVFNPHYDKTNTAYSLWLAIKQAPEPFYLVDGDVVFDPLLLKKMAKNQNTDLLVVDDRKKPDAEAVKVVTKNGGIGRIGKAIDLKEAEGEFIGLARFSLEWARSLSQDLTQAFADTDNSSLYYEDFINNLVLVNPPLHLFPTGDHLWSEVDTPEDFREINASWKI